MFGNKMDSVLDPQLRFFRKVNLLLETAIVAQCSTSTVCASGSDRRQKTDRVSTPSLESVFIAKNQYHAPYRCNAIENNLDKQKLVPSLESVSTAKNQLHVPYQCEPLKNTLETTLISKIGTIFGKCVFCEKPISYPIPV